MHDLALNGFGVVFGAAVRNMTVGPSSMSTQRELDWSRSERWLAEQNGIGSLGERVFQLLFEQLSSREPLMCTVAARRHPRAFHGIAAFSA